MMRVIDPYYQEDLKTSFYSLVGQAYFFKVVGEVGSWMREWWEEEDEDDDYNDDEDGLHA